MINFVQNTKQEDPKLAAVRRVVTRATTTALIVYAVGVFGLLAWWGYWSAREKTLSASETALHAQIVALSANEEVVRRLDSRSTFARDFLNKQDNVARHVTVINGLGVDIESWRYDAGASQTLKVTVESSARAEQVVADLLEVYQDVSLVTLDRDPEGLGFAAVISYGLPK